MNIDLLSPENFAQARSFLQKLVGDPTSPDPNNPDKPLFCYFEHKRENDALDAFIRELAGRSL